MAINKSQEQTLGKIGLYLPKLVFSHGQLYVAISRVRNKGSIKVLFSEIFLTTSPEMLFILKHLLIEGGVIEIAPNQQEN